MSLEIENAKLKELLLSREEDIRRLQEENDALSSLIYKFLFSTNKNDFPKLQ